MEITTKVKEFALMAKGNKAASYVLGGRLLGLAIVLYSALANSISLVDMVIWGGVGIAAQIIVFYLTEWVTPRRFNVSQSIEENNTAVGLFLLLLSVSIGIVIAGCLTY
jgi:putative membrane protein